MKRAVSDRDAPERDAARDALPGHATRKPDAASTATPRAAAPADDRRRQRVLAAALDGGGQAQHVGFAGGAGGDDRDQRAASLR